MFFMALKKIRLYAYQVTHFKQEISEVKQIFSKKNIEQNIKSISESPYILVTDELEEAPSNFVYGRFIKLREFALPLIINTKTADERDIDLLPRESVEEVSHFVWNLSDCILFGEYNHYGTRYFTYKLEPYLNTIFSQKEIDVSPVKDIETEEENSVNGAETVAVNNNDINIVPARDLHTRDRWDKQKDFVRCFRLKMAQEGLKKLAKDYDMSAADQLNWVDLFNFYNETIVEVIVRPRPIKNPKSYLDKMKKIISHILKDNNVEELDVRKLKVETADSVYDLIKDSLLEYNIDFEMQGKTISESYRPKLYSEMKNKYLNHITDIKEALRPCPP